MEQLKRVIQHPPIVFLDFRGVILTDAFQKRGHEKACERLDRFLKGSGAEVVITSPWRLNDTILHLQRMLREWGVINAKVVGLTPILGFEMENPHQRMKEISEWLAINNLFPLAPMNYLVFDAHFLPIGRKHVHVDGWFKGGIQEEHINKAFNIMKETREAQKREWPSLFEGAAG